MINITLGLFQTNNKIITHTFLRLSTRVSIRQTNPKLSALDFHVNDIFSTILPYFPSVSVYPSPDICTNVHLCKCICIYVCNSQFFPLPQNVWDHMGTQLSGSWQLKRETVKQKNIIAHGHNISFMTSDLLTKETAIRPIPVTSSVIKSQLTPHNACSMRWPQSLHQHPVILAFSFHHSVICPGPAIAQDKELTLGKIYY